MLLPALVLRPEHGIARVLRQIPLHARNVALDPARDDGDHMHAKGPQLDAQAVGVRLERRLGRIVDAAPHVGNLARHAANLHDRAFGLDQQRREGVADAHHGEDVDVEDVLHLLHVDVQAGHVVVAPGVVDEVVQAAAGGQAFDFAVESGDRGRVVDDEGERLDADVGEVGDARGLAACREDAQAASVELAC